MEERDLNLEVLFENTEHYLKSNVEILKLKSVDKSAEVLSSLAASLVVIGFVMIFFLILNIGIALWIGDILGKIYYGFFIISGFYALAGSIVYAYRGKWIKNPLRNSIIIHALK